MAFYNAILHHLDKVDNDEFFHSKIIRTLKTNKT